MTVETVSIVDAARPVFLGVDVGGTSIKIGLVDDIGRSIDYTSFPTADHLGPENAIERIRTKIDGILESAKLTLADVSAIGLGTPGTMDIPRGMILEPPNLPGWRNFAIRDALQAACDDTPVTFANDAGAAAYGEFWVGSAKSHRSMVMLTLGTGVGGGIIIDDVSIDGENSQGSECGHIIIDHHHDARICSCGKTGHLEAYASATSVVKRTREMLEVGRDSTLNSRLDAGEALSGLMIAQEAENGDELAIQIVMETADYLAIGIVTLAHVIDPAVIILGGAMNFGGHSTSLGRRFLQKIKSVVGERAFPAVAQKTVIDFATLGGDAGYVGAAGMSRRQQIAG